MESKPKPLKIDLEEYKRLRDLEESKEPVINNNSG
jgi:hypothetical protein